MARGSVKKKSVKKASPAKKSASSKNRTKPAKRAKPLKAGARKKVSTLKTKAKPAKLVKLVKSAKPVKKAVKKIAKLTKPKAKTKPSKARTTVKPSTKPSLATKILQAVGIAAPEGEAKTKKKAPSSPAPQAASPEGPGIGADVPEFSMPATNVGEVSSESLRGKPYVLYFYPKDDTSGCTAQACAFRDNVPEFDKLGLTVIGVSKDSIQSHEKFAEKHSLTFPLASDEATKVAESFGVWLKKSMYGRDYMGIDRSTFLVDAAGKIRAVWRKVDVPGHIEDVKKAIESLG